MIFWIYNILLIFLAPFWVPWMLWRAAKRDEKPNWKQRTGDLPIDPPRKGVRRVWIHAVSVGEVMAVLPILREVRKLDPGLQIVLSTTTSSGQAAAEERAEGLYDHLVYFPIDVPRFVVAAMSRVRPKALAIMESELWMNFLWTANQMGATTILMNGRISDRSYPRSMRIRPYYKAMFANLHQVLAQSETDADRFRELGFKTPVVVGNTKFDGAIDEARAGRDWRTELGIPAEASVVVIGSTRSELEENLILDALQGVDAYVVHAPRHVERAPKLAAEYKSKFGEVALRSSGDRSRYLVLDSYGELGEIYSIADVVVVGGGFDRLGGQNIIQPLAHGKPVIHGLHMENFKDVAASSVRVGASIAVDSATELTRSLNRLLGDEKERSERGGAARELVERNLGASRRCAEAIVEAARS
ncbi:MAG: 3-deoxy-D-manno-octulosonic acid transferase [Armatimonadetes bacterium]|nr:3-deoxy-D-manno-octulosonic acid transferase [Armatimonadota bacterium]